MLRNIYTLYICRKQLSKSIDFGRIIQDHLVSYIVYLKIWQNWSLQFRRHFWYMTFPNHSVNNFISKQLKNINILYFQDKGTIEGLTWDCSDEFDATSDQPISFLSDQSFISFPNWISRTGAMVSFKVNWYSALPI